MSGSTRSTWIEVPTCLTPGDAVILNSPTSLETGARGYVRTDEKAPLRKPS
jgi:hypothetical protein